MRSQLHLFILQKNVILRRGALACEIHAEWSDFSSFVSLCTYVCNPAAETKQQYSERAVLDGL